MIRRLTSYLLGNAGTEIKRVDTFQIESLEPRCLFNAVSLDPAFGTGGSVTTDMGSGFDEPVDVVTQPDGKIVVLGDGGSGQPGYTNAWIARYTAAGVLDSTFGTGGKLNLTPLGGGSQNVALQADGKILVSGDVGINVGTPSEAVVVSVIRLTSSGKLDTTFGNGGVYYSDPALIKNPWQWGLAVQANGKIDVGTRTEDNSTTPYTYRDYAVVQLTPSGQADATFGTNGTVIVTAPEEQYLFDVTTQPDGKVLLAGYERTSVGTTDTDIGDVVRLNTDGSPDASFGNNGRVDVDFGPATPDWSDINRVAVMNDGRIVLGSYGDPAGLARLLPNGQFDTSFGTGGKMIMPQADHQYGVSGMSVLGDGRIVTADTYIEEFDTGYNQHLKVVRYNANGTIDTTFNGTGSITLNVGGNRARQDAVTVDAQGRVILAAYTGGNWLTVRLVEKLPVPPPPPPPPTGTAAIRGTIFNDANANAARDTGEGILAGRTVWLDADNDKVLDATERKMTTDGNGNYAFTGLAAGTYRVRQVLPSGWRQSSPKSGASLSVTLTAGQSATGKLLGATQRVQISGNVFRDANGNGTRDSTETALSGWHVYIDRNNNQKFDTGDTGVWSDSAGNWTIDNLAAGTYVIRIVMLSKWKLIAPAVGAYTLKLGSGAASSGNKFALKPM